MQFPPMNSDLANLIELQKTDAEIARLQAEIAEARETA